MTPYCTGTLFHTVTCLQISLAILAVSNNWLACNREIKGICNETKIMRAVMESLRSIDVISGTDRYFRF